MRPHHLLLVQTVEKEGVKEKLEEKAAEKEVKLEEKEVENKYI